MSNNVKKAMEIIRSSKTQDEAYRKLEEAGIRDGMNGAVWMAFNGLPKKEKP